ncbi:GAS2 domain [Cordyceps militaris]|uniref:GAS2 domain n=1 Tax=Cordyceps militaris TaxID=73501 RepID=A0A2H4SFE5_CORMI|nr:GAS2 domain [Cordyceps militaris]
MTTFNERPLLFMPKRQSLGHSPTRSKVIPDDILLHITPSTTVEALLSPTGAIRACMALASPSQRDFAMRTALASQKISEWLEEMRAWTWPDESGSAGFEHGALQVRRNLFSSSIGSTSSQRREEDAYMGSLPEHEVIEYARRIEEIYHGMDQLEVEDIKTHILTSHVMPISRSTTPLSEGGHYNAAVPSYHRMDDLSAVVTAIVIQALPNLARLARFLQTWTMRITVLQHVNPVLGAIEDAEEIMDDAWEQVSMLAQEKARLERDGGGEPLETVLTKDTFGHKKRSIMRKVAKPGRTLDYMLDCLEGLDDTLPDHWLERMEVIESNYSEWAAVAERKIREIEWLRNILANQNEGGVRLRDESAYTDSDTTPEASMLYVQDNLANRVASRDTTPPKRSTQTRLSLSALGLVGVMTPNTMSQVLADSETPAKQRRSASDELAQAAMSPVKEEVEEEEELCLPELRSSVMTDVSDLADDTVLYGSHFDGMSSDGPEISASPTAFKGPIRRVEYFDDSPPSSPPLSPPMPDQHQMRDSVIALGDSPLVNSGLPEFDDVMGMKSPLDSSFMDDYEDSYSLPDIAPPTSAARRDSVGDQKLRRQISQIIEGIPAKIRLQSDTPNVNLNPPDLQLPYLKKKPSKDRFRRSGSALSSRTTTPSFTLSPAKSSRPPRPQRGQQEIKVYHLSRSTGEAPIKLFIRCVGQDGERVMVRVGGGWADLSEYLKDYASHHGRRSSKPEDTAVEVRDLPQAGRAVNNSAVQGSSPNSRPGSRLGDVSVVTVAPSTPLKVRKTRRSVGAAGSEAPRFRPKTPAAALHYSSVENTPGSDAGGGSARSRPGSRMSWVEDDSSFLGLAGPSGKKVEMSDENKAWVESVKEKVRLASGERKIPPLGNPPGPPLSSVAVNAASGVAPERSARGSTPVEDKKRFGELGKVGGTTRLFRKAVADGRRSGAQ